MIYSWSQFNYGHTVTGHNCGIVFSEGNGSIITTTIEPGSYTLQTFALAVQEALNGAGLLAYTVSVDRVNQSRLIISATSAFNLYLTGSNFTAAGLMGFPTNVDQTGLMTYTGANRCGRVYRPQFMVQSFTPPENFAESRDATINESASGRVELIRYGVIRKIEVEIKFITNLPMDGTVIKTDPNGVSRANDFLSYITSKAPFEFIADITLPSVAVGVFLKSTADSSDGTGYKLKELYADNVPDVFETGILTLQVNS